MQITLFEEDDIVSGIPEGIECKDCGVFQPISQFQVMQSGEIKRKCRTCSRDQAQTVARLRKENPYPDENYCCPICERHMDEIARHGQQKLQVWVLDHCHDTETFRGWVCFNCNTGLGGFKDNLTITQNAVQYLYQHKLKVIKNETSDTGHRDQQQSQHDLDCCDSGC